LRLDAIILLLFVCLFGSYKISAQTYNYTYTDPCTGNDKTIIVPINGNVTVGYYGEIGSFSYNDFNNGVFESWASNIFSQYGTNSPCSEIVGLGTAVNITQSTALNVIGILNSLSTISDIAGSTNILGGAVSSVSNSGNSEGSKKNKGNSQNNGEGSNNNSQGNSTNSGSNQNSSQGQENSGSNQGNAGGSTQGGGESSSPSVSNTNGNTQVVTPVNNNTGASTGATGTTNGTTVTSNGSSAGTTGASTGTTGTSNESSNGTTGTASGNNTQNGTGNTNGGGTSGTAQTTGNSTTQQGSQSNGQSSTQPGSQGTGEQTNNQSTGNGESGNNGSNGNNGNTGNSGNGSGNNNSNGQTEQGQTNTQSEQGQGKTNITGGASTTIKSTPTSKEGGKPTVVGSADFIGFNFKNSEVRTGAKATGGYTSMRWDGKRSYGALVDYTSALKGPNITAFYAWIRPKSIILASGTLTIGFEGNKSLYGTFAAGQMFNLKKPKNLKLLYMGTVSYGSVYRESFLGTALIVGAMYDFRVGKRFDIKLMNLFVYAPYVSYYNDVVLKSPYVMLPSIGTNIKISKKFKFNINGGGAWDLKTSALNYTITCGTRFVIGQ